MGKTRKVGDLFTGQDEKGYTYIQIYFIDSADEATYTPTYGQDGDQAPFDFPADTFVYYWEMKPASDHFVLTVKCHNDGYVTSSSGDWYSADKTQRRFGTSAIKFLPEWWGISQATAFQGGSRDNTDTPDPAVDPVRNIYDVDAHQGDYVFTGAAIGNKKVPIYTKSPFLASTCDATSMPLAWIGQDIPTIEYTCVFFARNSIMTYVGWKGVNGAGSTYFSPPSGCRPTGYENAGQWKSLSTQVLEDEKTFPNIAPSVYHSITRTMILAPNDLRFDPDKNGGTWTW